MDTIFLKELEAKTVIGAFEWERRIEQTVLIDIEMSTDISAVAASDNLEEVLDYKKVAKRVKDFAETNAFNLIETLAQKIAEVLIDEFDIQQTTVTVSKPRAIRGSKNRWRACPQKQITAGGDGKGGFKQGVRQYRQ